MQSSFFKRPPFWYGIYYGITSIVIFTLVYAINFELFGRFFLFMLVNVAVLATFLVMGGMADRKERGGYLKYFDAVKSLFFIGVIGYMINLLFSILFANVIDPDFNKNLYEVIKESTMNWMADMGAPEDKIDETMERMDKQMLEANKPITYIKQFFGSVGMTVVFALICALFVKRNPPEGMVEEQVIDAGI